MGRLTHSWPPMDVYVAFLLGRGLTVGWPQVPVAPSSPAEIDLGDPPRICRAVTVSWGLPSFMESSSLEDHAADRRGPRSMEFALVRWLFSRPSRCRGQLVRAWLGRNSVGCRLGFPSGTLVRLCPADGRDRSRPTFVVTFPFSPCDLGSGLLVWVTGQGFRPGFSAWVLGLGS
jgi:hypothetical protein